MSPAWFSWVGSAPALELLLDIGIETIRDHDLRLANLFREGLGLEPGDSAIVSAELPEAEERLRGTPVMASARAGMLRTSWHVYNTEDDVERVLGLLSGAGPPLRPRIRRSMTSARRGEIPFTIRSSRTIGGWKSSRRSASTAATTASPSGPAGERRSRWYQAGMRSHSWSCSELSISPG